MRIDRALAEHFGSRSKAADAVKKGYVQVNGRAVNASYELKNTDSITFLQPDESFVSAGGFKLQKALKDFHYRPSGKIFADIGASTGGFTDCLYQNGAKKVYCFDVGESQLDESLKKYEPVVIDNFNARNIKSYPFQDKLDGVVIDVSFISLTYLLEAVADIIPDNGIVIALIKPQFECESKSVGKNGIVKDRALHEKIITKIYNFGLSCNLNPVALTNAPIVKNKNLEYLMMFEKSGNIKLSINYLIKSVKL